MDIDFKNITTKQIPSLGFSMDNYQPDGIWMWCRKCMVRTEHTIEQGLTKCKECEKRKELYNA